MPTELKRELREAGRAVELFTVQRRAKERRIGKKMRRSKYTWEVRAVITDVSAAITLPHDQKCVDLHQDKVKGNEMAPSIL